MYRVTNISGGQLVCTLADGKTTLRLDNKKSEEVSEKNMTPYLRSIEKKKLVKIVQIEDKTTAKTNSAAPKVVEEKKEG